MNIVIGYLLRTSLLRITLLRALVVCLAAVNFQVMAAAPSLSEIGANKKKVEEAHHQRSSSCFACHKDTESAQFKEVMRLYCIQCHAAGWVKGKLESLNNEPGEALVGKGQPTKKAEGQGPGMQMPMYYSASKIGAQPNPMVSIAAGDFIRGTNNRLPDEGPQHTVTLKAFAIDKYEVTNLQYAAFIKATGRAAPEHFVNGAPPEGKVDHPVVYVSWFDAKAYCEWAGKRLPDDKEWEKVARGTDGRTYPWGEEFSIERVNSPVRWTTLKLIGDTTPVGAFEGGKSVYGVYDMSGNAWEWTSSRYEAYPGNTRQSENYGGNYRVLKGGSWWDCSFYQCGISAPVYNRSFFHPKTKNGSFGFRCAKDAQ